MRPTLLALAIASMTAMSAANASDSTDLTIYRSDDASLYSSGDHGSIGSGYALVHERRGAHLTAGTQTLDFDGLPPSLDTEALDVDFPDADTTLLSRRLLLPGNAGLLSGHVGDMVKVFGTGGALLAQGTLRGNSDGLLVDTGNGLVVVRDYAAVQLADTDVRAGARLQVALDAKRAGDHQARLDYPTGGLGWRAAYTATLHDGDTCHIDFASFASIANRSGRDWQADRLKLVAGEPNFAKASAPRPMMSMRAKTMAVAAYADTPEQTALGDYRSYTVAGAVALPDASVTQVPLYAPRTLDCTRTWLYENGNSWTPSQPMLARDFGPGASNISSRLGFEAFDALPAGYLRVLAVAGANRELLGEARIDDTPAGRTVNVELGTPFDLRAEREQTAFHVDKAARTLDEAFRITLSNAGDTTRPVTVREHPVRWREWTLTSSSAKPAKQGIDTLEFVVEVPAHGKAVLEYAVRYKWRAEEDRE